ncbi:MAG: hypothetical protein Q8Q86_01095 [Candidatus Daviesbacteria bacterium]|nr:hypothetical protein [Candidatus Daviesbacteria bacterium]
MTNNDLNQIKGAFKEEIGIALNKRLSATEQMFDKKLTDAEKRLKTEIAATEKRFNSRLASTEEHLKSEIATSGDNIIEEIAGFMEVNILPKLEGKVDKSNIERIERRLDHVNDKIGGHDVRIKDIESIPAVVLQLAHTQKESI